MGKRHAYEGQMKSMTPPGITGLERVNTMTMHGTDKLKVNHRQSQNFY
jgi:hypothetical protein